LLLAAAPVSAQVADQLLVYTSSADNILIFDRKLSLLAAVDLQPAGVVTIQKAPGIDSQGRAWIPFAASAGPEQVQRLAPDGTILPTVPLQYEPAKQVPVADGRVFCLSRSGLSSAGPVYCMSADGNVLWSSWAGPSLFTSTLPQNLAVTTNGELWMGCETAPPGKFWWQSRIARIDPDDGSVLQSYWLPDLTNGVGDESFSELQGALDGTLWIKRGGPGGTPGASSQIERTDGSSILQTIPVFGAGGNGFTGAMRVDGVGKLYVVTVYNSQTGAKGNQLRRYDPASPAQPEAVYTFGEIIIGYALGAGGDDAFAVIGKPPGFPGKRLERMNLVTGRKSAVSLEAWASPSIPYGDVNGFIYANINDRQGDNDGDGIPNGVETAARSNPFDPLSRPDGPKVFVDFEPGTNAIKLIYQDPDGLVDPQGGLDVASLSLEIGSHGNVFNFLLAFATGLTVSPDLKQATLTFGALPIPNNKKWRIEASVTDLSGATGWDWQVTPPGDL